MKLQQEQEQAEKLAEQNKELNKIKKVDTEASDASKVK